MGKISKAFDLGEFSKVASMPDDGFNGYGETTSKGNKDGDTYIYQDNGSSVLGVAHLDTVQGASRASVIHVEGERVLICPKLDDRLGVYIITHVLPKLGINCDWLLTTGEESGNSSAEWFKTEKAYNWAFSFDRAGDDAVLYHHDHKALRKALNKFGFRIGEGTFSDLSYLSIGCSGVNIGCGYHNEHGIHAYALLSQTFSQIGLFKRLWLGHADKPLPYDPDSSSYMWRHAYSAKSYGGYSSGYTSGYNYNSSYRGINDRFPDWQPGGAWREQDGTWFDQDGNLISDADIEQLADDAAKDAERPDPVG